MIFKAYGDVILCQYTLFDTFSEVRAFTSTRLKSSSLSYHDSVSGNHQNENWNPPDWLRSVRVHPDRVARIRQVHGNRVYYARQPGFLGEGDGIMSDQTGIYLRVVTADCLPVFFYDRTHKACGLVHAGWRGLSTGIVNTTIAEMNRRFSTRPADVSIAVGPFIQKCCYEVGQDVATMFPGECADASEHGRRMLDLGRVISLQLQEIGVPGSQVEISGHCTSCEEDRFHSYRRDRHRAGRMTSIMGIDRTE